MSYWVYLANWPHDLAGAKRILGALGLVIVWLAGTMMFWMLIRREGISSRGWRTLAIASLGAFTLGCVLPSFKISRELSAAATANREAAQRLGSLEAEARRRWLRDIQAAGAHGGPGDEPPMLTIRDQGRRVLVRNLGSVDIQCMRLSRGGSPLRVERRDCAHLAGGTTAVFMLDSRGGHIETAPLEFEVGDPLNPDPSWWSDAALARKFGQELELETADAG